MCECVQVFVHLGELVSVCTTNTLTRTQTHTRTVHPHSASSHFKLISSGQFYLFAWRQVFQQLLLGLLLLDGVVTVVVAVIAIVTAAFVVYFAAH